MVLDAYLCMFVIWAQFHYNLIIWLKLNQNMSDTLLHISDKLVRNVKSRIYSLPMHEHNYQLYLFEQ